MDGALSDSRRSFLWPILRSVERL